MPPVFLRLPKPCPPLDPETAQARFDAMDEADSRRLMNSCWWSWGAVVGFAVGGLMLDDPWIMGCGLVASAVVLWCEYRRRCAKAPDCPVQQGLWAWIDEQDDPQGCARTLSETERHGTQVRMAAGRWMARADRS